MKKTKVEFEDDDFKKLNIHRFKVVGHAMDDGSSEAIIEGDIVTAKRISKENWTSEVLICPSRPCLLITSYGARLIGNIISFSSDHFWIHVLNLDASTYPDYGLKKCNVIEIYQIFQITRDMERSRQTDEEDENA